MIIETGYSESFKRMYSERKMPVAVIGNNEFCKKVKEEVEKIDYIYTTEGNIGDIDAFPISELKNIISDLYVILSETNEKKRAKIINTLKKIDNTVILFNYHNNVSFGYSFWETDRSYVSNESWKKIWVNIVCRDEGWIFKKFADKMKETLEKQNVKVTVSKDPCKEADINHHIPYVAYEPQKNDTLMITHVDNSKKIDLLKKQLEIAGMGICMSKDTMNMLTLYGVPRKKLCYINPAHDGIINPKKYVIGLTYKCHHEDFRKRDTALLDILEGINPDYFEFKIMGAGWEKIIKELRKKGFAVEYHDDFDREKYVVLMQSLDFFMYMGFDEGTMGYVDAMAAGVGTIVTPQGYHLDTECDIDYPCTTISEFHNAFLDLQRKRERKVNSVSDWSWEKYSLKHLEVWKYLLNRGTFADIYKRQLEYNDGIFSVIVEDNR